MNAQYLQLIVSPRSYIDNNQVLVLKRNSKERLNVHIAHCQLLRIGCMPIPLAGREWKDINCELIVNLDGEDVKPLIVNHYIDPISKHSGTLTCDTSIVTNMPRRLSWRWQLVSLNHWIILCLFVPLYSMKINGCLTKKLAGVARRRSSTVPRESLWQCSYILNIHIFQTKSSSEFQTGFSL